MEKKCHILLEYIHVSWDKAAQILTLILSKGGIVELREGLWRFEFDSVNLGFPEWLVGGFGFNEESSECVFVSEELESIELSRECFIVTEDPIRKLGVKNSWSSYFRLHRENHL